MELIYNAEQLSAIEKATDFIINGNPDEYYLIEGKAGTGKTTVIKEVLKKFRNRHIIGCALSHKAKNVLRKSISSANICAEYFSVAGMLNMVLDLETGVFKKIYIQGKNKVPPIQKADIIIVDEASMINEETIEYIFSEKKYTCKVIFLGDIGQLPPIRTLENTYYLNWNPEDLNKISPVFENKNKSKLLIRVRQGEESPILPFADYFWNNSQTKRPQEYPVFSENRKSVITDNGALLFVNKTNEIFDKFQQIPVILKESVELHNEIIKSKFDQAKNYLHKVGRNKKYYELLGIAWKEKDKYPNIDLSYAVSSHTSQGSTYDICVVHEQDINSVSMIDAKQKSQSIYTAITRAKNICIVISDQNVDNSNIDFKNLNLIELNNKYNGNV
jgi:ATP-dependent exoDNAse (exonuclease V) alpha subunit